MVYFARSPNQRGEMQLLRDHLQQVAARAAAFAADCGLPGELGEWSGLLHDLGKYSDEFQRYRLGMLPNGTTTPERARVEHAAHGACIAAERHALEVAFAVAGHHTGLGTPTDIRELLLRKEHALRGEHRLRDRAADLLARAQADSAFADLPPASSVRPGEELEFELRTRLLLSCLVED